MQGDRSACPLQNLCAENGLYRNTCAREDRSFSEQAIASRQGSSVGLGGVGQVVDEDPGCGSFRSDFDICVTDFNSVKPKLINTLIVQ